MGRPLPASLGPASPKGGVLALRKTSAAVVTLGHLLPGLRCAAHFSLLHPAYSQSLDVGLAAGLVLLEGQSTARQLHHAEKCTGVVYVAAVCERRQWVGVRILGS